MKKILSYIFMFGAVAALTLSSCAKKEVYQTGEPDLATCYGVYFPSQEASGSHTYDPEMEKSITVTIARNQEKPFIDNAITVPYVLKASEEGIFQAGNITFEAGQAETALDIDFDKAELGTNYAVTLEITDPEYASKYSNKATFLNFDVLVVAWQYVLNPKGEKALFEFTQGWWDETAWAYIKYYEVNGIRTCYTETQPMHEYDGEYYEGYGFFGTAKTPEEATEWTFRWYTNNKNTDGNQLIELPFQYSGYTTSTGVARYVSDLLWYYITDGQITAAAWLPNAEKNGAPNGDYPCGYYDGNGGLYIYTTGYYYNNGSNLVGSWTDEYEVVGIGEGFVRTDYSLSLETDYPSNGVSPIYVEAGTDIASIKYAIYAGELKEDEVNDKVNAIAAGTEQATEFSKFEFDEESGKNYAVLGVSPETTGTYTIAVVGFDVAGTPQAAEGITFNFISANDEKDYAVEITVATEDVPARYGDFPTSSSFAFYVMGKNIKEAHINIYTTKDFEEDKEAILAEMKEVPATSNVYVAPAGVLSEINVPGGFYTYTSGLKALTSYTVVVWATNGEMETWETAEYTTAGLPNVLLTTGDFYYTGWFLKISGSSAEYVVDPGLELYQNPNIDNTYVITHWGYNVDFTFTVDPKTNVINWDYFYSGYSTGGTNLLVVNSKDIWTEAYLEEHPEFAEDSYLDKETGVYHFNMAYYAPGYGVQTCTWETFVPNEEGGGEEPTSIKFNSSSVSLSGATMYGVKNIQLPAREFKALPRESQPVKANVTVSYTRKEKENGRNSEPTFRASDKQFFE